MPDIRQVTDSFSVAPQFEPGDMAEAAKAGFRIVIDNRPDAEGRQLQSGLAEAEAKAAGLQYYYAPFQGQPTPAAIQALTEAVGSGKGPVLAYCRSGTRSITAWAIAAAQNGWATPEEIIATARTAGYQLDNLKEFLRNLAAR